VTDFNYVGIDETTLAVGNGGLIIVAAYTANKELTRQCQLEKAGDLLKKRVENSGKDLMLLFPTLVEMYSTGLDGFYWMRANKGRFNRQEIEHASIAHLVANQGFDPKKTVLLIDNFYGNGYKTEELIFNYLQRQGFRIPRKNIECHAGGDSNLPIINYADLLAFQITVGIRRKYDHFFPNATKFPIEINEIPFNEARVKELTESDRIKLELLLSTN
tara:strand:+ start:4269 stop:4919 length:651 start_codon:yes stop_codon:yes gene_type:complete